MLLNRLFLISLLVFVPTTGFSEYRFQSTTTDDVITLNTPQVPVDQVHTLWGGGGLNFVLVDSDLFEDSLGGEVVARYTYRETVSLESTTSFNRFNIDANGFDGDFLGAPTLLNVLLHSSWWNNIRFYVLAGAGIQFNDADAEADVNQSALGGKVITLPSQAAIEQANNELIVANARVTALSSSSTTSSADATQTDTVGSTIRQEAALAAAQSDAEFAAANLNAARQSQSVDLKNVVIPAGTKVDVDIDNGFVIALGGGVDVQIAENILLNFEARYQTAEFDVTGSVSVPGVGIVKIEDEEDFDVFYFITRFLWRF